MPFDGTKVPPLSTQDVRKNLGKIIGVNDDAIIKTATAYVDADVASNPASQTYHITQQEAGFARVSVSTGEGGGYALVLKKVHELWVVVAGGQDLPSKATGEKYGLPQGWFSLEY